MKKLIIACLAAAALVSLSACTTTKGGQPAPVYNTTTTPTPNPASAPIITDPHGGV